MAYRYPYGNTEQMNLDWFLNQWEKFKADWAEAKAGIDGSLDAEIAKVEAAMSELYAARDAAAASASAARQSSLDAAAAQVAAGNSKTAAQAAETVARGSQQAAAQSAQEAQASAQGAENSALTASQAAITATQQAAGADAARGAAVAAQQAAEDAQAAASQSAGQAGQAATAAADHANDAADSATLAQQAAQDMSDSVEQITTNKNDISDLKESISKTEFTKTINNVAVATFNDGVQAPVKKLLIYINTETAITSATIYKTGLNMLDIADAGIATKSNYNLSSGEISTGGGSTASMTGTNPVIINNTATWRGITFLSKPLKAGITYRISHRIKGTNNANIKRTIYLINDTNTIISKLYTSSSVEASINSTYRTNAIPSIDGLRIALCVESSSVGNEIEIYDLRVTILEQSEEYELYDGATYIINFPSEVGAITQGIIDLVNKKLIVDNVEYDIANAPNIETTLDYNNIWANTGNIKQLIYRANEQEYIDDQDKKVKSIIAPVLNSMIADTALVVNDFRIVDNILYRVTAPIASDGTLIVDTNVIVTTVADVLKSLLI